MLKIDLSNAPTTNRPANAGMSVNDNVSRIDGVAKVTGAAKYGRDQYPAGCHFAAFIRCPWGSAQLTADNRDEVKGLPGVVEISLTRKEADYHGRDMGYILADSPSALRGAFAALKLTWKRREVKTLIEDSLGEPPALDVDAKRVFDGAAHQLDAIYSTPVQTHSSLESHGCVVDHRGDYAVVYASTQGTFAFRDGLAEPLGLNGSQFEVNCEYVGGGFGSKLGGPGKEGLTAARLAAKYKKPVYLFCNRKEEHLDTGNRPSSRTHVRVGINKDGSIAGGQINTWGGVGVARGGGGCTVPSGRYDLGNVKKEHADISLNAGGPRAMRAPGHPQGSFAEEMMLEELAALAGLDPLQVRLKAVKSDAARQMLESGARMIGWSARQKNGSQTSVIRRGFGMGVCSWGSPRAPAEAEVVIFRDGSVEARTGTQDMGSGQRTIMAVAAADSLSIPVGNVRCAIGNSRLPSGPGSGGSVTAPSTVPAMRNAADDARRKLLELVAEQINGKADELSIKQGDIFKGDAKLMTWSEACARIKGESLAGRGDSRGRRANEDKGHSDGVQFVDLTVDTETGVVRVNRVIAIQSCGRVMSRKTAESQIIGGVIQGLSYGLYEQRVLDRVTGAMLNANLESYKILGTRDMPLIEPILWSEGQTATRSIGEPPVIPTAAATACAVFNAIGVPVRSLPITPDKVLAALASKSASPKGGA